MPLRKPNPNLPPSDHDNSSLLAPTNYDDDASSLHSRSDQDTDSDDDQLQMRARNSRELRAADRIVLMEEEDIDRLVTDTRRNQERSRRGSNLNVPNPFKMLGRRASNSSLTSNEGGSTEKERRKRRKARRQEKKKRLMEDAQHGEDGELMYEMESGAIKNGSSTGESSDREDSEEMDRRRLGTVNSAKAGRRQSWRRWILIHSLIAIGFSILVLTAWKLTKNRKGVASKAKANYLSNGTALFAPTTIIISLDGFRADFLRRGITPRLGAFVKEGVSPKYMLPSFPSVTFPNHYTLATGLYPESHGVVSNTFWDPELQAEFYYTDPAKSLDPKWWGGEPFWVTAEHAGIRTAVHMWPGSEAHVLDTEPSFMDKYNGKEKLDNKVARILEFLDKPGKEDKTAAVKDMRPQLIAAYVPNIDADGHKYGPNSTEILTTIQNVDNMLDNVFQGLEQRNLTDIVNVIVVSDHGMATTDISRLMQLEDLVDVTKIEHIDGWPLYGLRPKDPKDLQPLYDGLAKKAESNPNFEVYLRDKNMPERYHFSNNERIAPLWIVPKAGWAIVTNDEFNIEKAEAEGRPYKPHGLHGYDHEHPLMRAIFVARGPAFPHPANSEIGVFQNIEVYNMLCDSIGMEPKPNNGTLRLPLKPLGIHKPEDDPEVPEDNGGEEKPAAPQRPNKPEKPTEPTKQVKPIQPGTTVKPGTSPDESAPPTQDEPSEESPTEDDEEPDEDKEKGIKGLWDCVKHKVEHVWGKITGSKEKEDEESEDEDEED